MKRQDLQRTILKYSVIIIAFFILVLLISLVFLSTRPGEKLLRGFAESQLSALLKQTVSIQKLETNLFSRLQIVDLRVAPENHRELPLLYLKSGSLSYNLSDIFRKRLTVHSITLDSLVVHVQRDSSGLFNFPQEFFTTNQHADTSKSAPLAVAIRSLSLRNAWLYYEDAAVPLSASLFNLSVLTEQKSETQQQFSVRADSVSLNSSQFPLTGRFLLAQGSLQQNVFQLDSLALHLPDMFVHGVGKAHYNTSAPAIDGRLFAEGNIAKIAARFPEIKNSAIYPVQGDVRVALLISGEPAQPEVDYKFEVADIHCGQFYVDSGRVAGMWTENSLKVDEMVFHLYDGIIEGRGGVTFDSLLAYAIAVDMSQISLEKIWPALYNAETAIVQGDVSGNLTAQGNDLQLLHSDIRAQLNLSALQYQNRLLPDMATNIIFAEQRGELSIEQGTTQAHAHFSIEQGEIRGTCTADIYRLAPLAILLNISELKGELHCSGDFAGTITSPEITLALTGKNIMYENFPIDTLNGSVALRDSSFSINYLEFFGKCDRIDSSSSPFDIAELSGGFVYSGSARGPLNNPTASFMIEIINPSYKTFQADAGILQISIENQMAVIHALQIKKDSVYVTAAGNYALDTKRGEITVAVNHLPVDAEVPIFPIQSSQPRNLQRAGSIVAEFSAPDSNDFLLDVQCDSLSLAQVRPIVPEVGEIAGFLRFKLDARLGQSHPEANVHFSLSQPRYETARLDSITGSLQVSAEGYTVDPLIFYQGDDAATINLRVESIRNDSGISMINENSTISGRALAKSLDLRFFTPFFPDAIRVQGIAGLDVHMDGKIGAPKIKGKLQVRDGALIGVSKKPIVERLALVASVDDSVLTISNAEGWLHSMAVRAEGRIVMSKKRYFHINTSIKMGESGKADLAGIIAPDSLRLTSHLKDFSLMFFESLLPDVTQLAGMCNANVVVSGALKNPSLTGNLELQETSIQTKIIRERIEKCTALVRFDTRTITVDSLSFSIGGGSVKINGEIAYQNAGLEKASISIKMENISVTRPDVVKVQIRDASLQYAQYNSHYTLEGDVILGESRVIQTFKPQALLSFARRVERPLPKPSPLLSSTHLDVRIRDSENLWIDNNLAHLRLHSEISILGSPLQPNIAGRISAREGYVLYLDRKFKVTKGDMDFIDPNRINPIIDLATESQLKAYQTMQDVPYTIFLNITGPLDHTELSLTSEPFLDRGDILALLTFGATRRQLTGGNKEGTGTNVGDILRERLAAYSSSRLSGYAEKRMGTLLGLEQMSIEGNLFQFGKSWGPQLLASKKLSNRMSLTYTTTVGHMNEQSIRLNYMLSRYFSLQGQTDQRARSSLDLKYSVKFK